MRATYDRRIRPFDAEITEACPVAQSENAKEILISGEIEKLHAEQAMTAIKNCHSGGLPNVKMRGRSISRIGEC